MNDRSKFEQRLNHKSERVYSVGPYLVSSNNTFRFTTGRTMGACLSSNLIYFEQNVFG